MTILLRGYKTPKLISRDFGYSSISQNVPDSLTFSPTLSVSHVFSLSVSHSLTFSQVATSAGHLISQSFSLNQSISVSHVFSLTTSHSLAFSSIFSRSLIRPRLISNSLSFSQSTFIGSGDIVHHSFSFSQSLSLIHVRRLRVFHIFSLSSSPVAIRSQSLRISQSLSLTSSFSRNIVSNRPISQSLSFLSIPLKKFTSQHSLSQSLTFSPSLSLKKFRFFTLSQALTFSPSSSRSRTSPHFFQERLILSDSVERNIEWNRSQSEYLNLYDLIYFVPNLKELSVLVPLRIPRLDFDGLSIWHQGSRLNLSSPEWLNIDSSFENVKINGIEKLSLRVHILMDLNRIPVGIDPFLRKSLILQNRNYESYAGYLYHSNPTLLEFDGVKVS